MPKVAVRCYADTLVVKIATFAKPETVNEIEELDIKDKNLSEFFNHLQEWINSNKPK